MAADTVPVGNGRLTVPQRALDAQAPGNGAHPSADYRLVGLLARLSSARSQRCLAAARGRKHRPSLPTVRYEYLERRKGFNS